MVGLTNEKPASRSVADSALDSAVAPTVAPDR
jgi:hypothetical protein